jgi:hypothetical protein
MTAPAVPQARSQCEIREAARLANCPQCWQRPGPACTVSGDHLARYQRAERRGLIGREDLAAVVAGLEVIAAHVIVRGGAL